MISFLSSINLRYMAIGIRNILVIIVMSLIIVKFSRFERTGCNSELRV